MGKYESGRGISVVVCCFNSETRISETLRHLAAQDLVDGFQYEVIVVDNNSTDFTARLAESDWEKYGAPFPMRVVPEARPGLSFARKTGVRSANNELVCFCDDDNWLSPRYLADSIEIMSANPMIGVLAGQGEAVSTATIPAWFYSRYGAFACGALAIDSGDVTYRNWVWGAGMVVRREVLLKMFDCGFEHVTTDRIGNDLTSGGDNEICYWHVLAGFRLWYDERLSFKHFMPEERLRKDYAAKLFEGQKRSSEKLKKYKIYLRSKKERFSLRSFTRALIGAMNGEMDDPFIVRFCRLATGSNRHFYNNLDLSLGKLKSTLEK